MPNRRGTTWHRVSFAGTAIASGAQGISNLLQNLPVMESVGCTIIRIIHDVTYYFSSGETADVSQLISIGIGIVSEESFAALVVPDPNSNIDEPPAGWLYRAVGPVHRKQGQDQMQYRTNVDLRAQRKLGRAILVHIVNNDPIEGTAQNVRQAGLVSVLCMNP